MTINEGSDYRGFSIQCHNMLMHACIIIIHNIDDCFKYIKAEAYIMLCVFAYTCTMSYNNTCVCV